MQKENTTLSFNFQAIFEAQAGLILVISPQLIILEATSAFLRETNLQRNQVIGRNLFDVFPDNSTVPYADTRSIKASVEQVFSNGKQHQIDVFQNDMLHPNFTGRLPERYWSIITSPVLDQAGKVTSAVFEIINITDRSKSGLLQTESQQRKQETQVQPEPEQISRRLTDLFMEAPAAICILNGPDLVYELINPGYAQLFPNRELLGKPILEALPEIKDNPVYKTFREVYETGRTHEEAELLIPIARPVDGVLEDRYFRYVQQPRFNEQGIVDGVIVFALEVTEQVEARMRVEASARQLRLVTDSLPVLIGYLDQERKYRFTNKAYERWFPLKAEELIGRYVKDVVGEKAYNNTSAYMDKALAGEQVDFEASMPYREGFTKHTHTNYVPDVQSGVVKGFYTLVTDITDQVEARKAVMESEQRTRAMADELADTNLELQAANKELGKANQRLTHINIDLDNFIYTASHDLRAPISNIERLLEELKLELSESGSHQGEVKHITEMMKEAVDRFKKTISSLTEITKLQKDGKKEATLVNLVELVNEVILDLEPSIRKSGEKLEVSIDADTSVSFLEKNLRSIVYNLLANAIKYRHPDRVPSIQLHSHEEAEYLVLTVQDNGLGLSAKNQAKLFTMFRRFHDHVEGSGIGLYMVKRIVDNVGGKIEVDSEVGLGTTFRVYLKK